MNKTLLWISEIWNVRGMLSGYVLISPHGFHFSNRQKVSVIQFRCCLLVTFDQALFAQLAPIRQVLNNNAIKKASNKSRPSSIRRKFTALRVSAHVHTCWTVGFLLHVFAQALVLFALGFILQRKSHFLKQIRVLAQGWARVPARRRKLAIRINKVMAGRLHAKMIEGTAHSS